MIMSDLAVRVEKLSKRYKIGPPEPYEAFRFAMANQQSAIANCPCIIPHSAFRI
jgi:hypothetical protein